jgi:hypothetical protein
MRTWKPDWDFYMTRVGEQPMSMRIDLAAERHVPLASHPLRLTVRVVMHQPTPEGLRSDEEAPALFALEDALDAALAAEAEAIFVFSYILHGRVLWEFQVPAPQKEAATATLLRLRGQTSYVIEGRFVDDPEWQFYRDSLPNERGRHLIMNRRLRHQRQEHGDVERIPRTIDHCALFPTEEVARQAAATLVVRGYTMAAPPKRRDGAAMWVLEFSRIDACTPLRPDEWTGEILDVLEPLGGVYDGWGATVETGPE